MNLDNSLLVHNFRRHKWMRRPCAFKNRTCHWCADTSQVSTLIVYFFEILAGIFKQSFENAWCEAWSWHKKRRQYIFGRDNWCIGSTDLSWLDIKPHAWCLGDLLDINNVNLTVVGIDNFSVSSISYKTWKQAKPDELTQCLSITHFLKWKAWGAWIQT